jgi:quercetin dioxygenase-like cupin family protein
MTRFNVMVCGLVLATLGACTEADTGEVGQETAGAGVAGVVQANVSFGVAKTEITASGHYAEIKGPQRMVTQEITLQPGGHTGWHSHGGLALVSVASGALSLYTEHDPCEAITYAAGVGFLDPGGGHTHIGVNETSGTTVLHVTYILPEGAAVRIDAAAPPGADACP